MKLEHLSIFAAVSILTLLTCSFSGCGGGKELTEIYGTNIKKVHQCYVMYMEDHAYKGPADEAELKDYLKTNPTAVHLIARIGVTPETVDDIFISDRDGEPFVIRYGLKGVASHAIVFEATGVDGKRLIAFTTPVEVGETKYEAYLSGEIKPEREAGIGAGQVQGEGQAEEETDEE